MPEHTCEAVTNGHRRGDRGADNRPHAGWRHRALARPAGRAGALRRVAAAARPTARRGARASRHRAALHASGAGDRRRHRRARPGGGDTHRIGQDALLQRAGRRRGDARALDARALPLPHQGAGAGPAAGAARAGVRGRDRPEDVHVRRRHATAGAPRGAHRRARRDHQSRHAAHRHPAQPHEVGAAVREPALRRYRRAAHVPRRLRLARRERVATAASHLPLLRLRPGLHLLQRHHRQPRAARLGAHRARRGAGRRQRRAAWRAGDRAVQPAGGERAAWHPLVA